MAALTISSLEEGQEPQFIVLVELVQEQYAPEPFGWLSREGIDEEFVLGRIVAQERFQLVWMLGAKHTRVLRPSSVESLHWRKRKSELKRNIRW